MFHINPLQKRTKVEVTYSDRVMAVKRWSCMMVAVLVWVAQPARALPELYNCSESFAKLSMPVQDPCGNTTAYSELGSCASYMAGNTTTPSPDCCASAHNVWVSFPACFCKVTFFSKFPGDGPALARARPPLCNITDDLCTTCPHYMSPYQSGNGGGNTRKLNTASVVTISVIVTLAIVGCAWLVYWCKKKALSKQKQSQKQSQSKNFVPHFNNV